MPHPPRALSRACALIALGGLGLAAARCYQVPAGSGGGDYTSVGTTGSTPSTGSPEPNATVAPEAAGTGTMTLTPSSNPYVCLTASDARAGAGVSATTCSGSSKQRWLLRRNRLMLTDALCLGPDAAAANGLGVSPTLAPCDANSSSQVLFRGGNGGIVYYIDGQSASLAAQLPTGGNANVVLTNIDPNNPGQLWAMGADTAASGTLVLGYVPITSAAGKNVCLSAEATGLTHKTCSNSPAQLWRWGIGGQVLGSGGCLTAGAVGQAASVRPCSDARDTNQIWLSPSGQLISGSGAASGCLSAAGGVGTPALMAPCAAEPNQLYALGAAANTTILP